jgi:hypothetical protein
MVAFQLDATHNVWTHGSKVMRFLIFQPKFGHALTIVNAVESAQFCPKLPKSAKIYPKTISLKNFEMPPKIEILLFLKNRNFYV